ncbi:hypothetical protein L3X38_013932 [Prunus dulcis]|uniref:Uncharacterized protein n=1 Tax=Prunus dulcis TaxID=3755 RepID=A0AAD4WM50_PRUDU|nr:hypothetical protein L3X38_013932 [Prunus dulcis]
MSQYTTYIFNKCLTLAIPSDLRKVPLVDVAPTSCQSLNKREDCSAIRHQTSFRVSCKLISITPSLK